MPRRGWLPGPAAVVALALLTGCDKPTTPGGDQGVPGETAPRSAPAAGETGELKADGPFDDAQVFFELNATANDLGLQLFLDAEGWKRVRVTDPRRHQIVMLQAEGNLADLGITELRFESAEPSPEEVLALFPPGQYRFRGWTVEGEQLASSATLSHDFLPAPTFTPSGGAAVDPANTVVVWNAPGAEMVEVIIENEELGHVLDVTLSGSTTRLRIPPQFLRPNQEYKIEILSISENGNRTIAESTFTTES